MCLITSAMVRATLPVLTLLSPGMCVTAARHALAHLGFALLHHLLHLTHRLLHLIHHFLVLLVLLVLIGCSSRSRVCR